MAAGKGERLRPLTYKTPKCLLPVMGKTMLEWWLDSILASEMFDRVFLNVHHFADQVEVFVKHYQKSRRMSFITILDERDGLLGTAGTLFKAWDVKGKDFMVGYVDTFSVSFFRSIPGIVMKWNEASEIGVKAGLLGFISPNDGSSGSITAKNGIITSFNEKTNGQTAWAGIMFGGTKFMSSLKSTDVDLAKDVFPRMVNEIVLLDMVDAYDIGRGIKEYEFFKRKIQQA